MFHATSTPPSVERLPSSIKTTFQAEEWARTQFAGRSMSERAAFIAANDLFVAVLTSHSVCDGGSMHSLVNMRPVKAPRFPYAVDLAFSDEIAGLSKDRIERYIAEGDRISWLPRSKTVDPGAKWCGYVVEDMQPEQLLCYNKETRSIKGLTEALWSALVLPFIASTGCGKIGCATCYDLRPYVPWKAVGNIYAALPVVCGRVGDDTMTLEEVGQEMRKDFRMKVKNKDYILPLKTLYAEYAPGPNRRLTPQYSSMGIIRLEDPVIDLLGGGMSSAKGNKGTIIVLNQTLKTKEGLTVSNRLQYSPAVLNKKDATRLLRSIGYVLRSIPQQTRLREAIDELKKFQRKENL
jgi:hypothetical protein